jgi:hypothetical protein
MQTEDQDSNLSSSTSKMSVAFGGIVSRVKERQLNQHAPMLSKEENSYDAPTATLTSHISECDTF